MAMKRLTKLEEENNQLKSQTKKQTEEATDKTQELLNIIEQKDEIINQLIAQKVTWESKQHNPEKTH